VLPSTYMTDRKQRKEPHEHVAWARGRHEFVNAIERAGGRPRERVVTRAGPLGLGRRRGQ
jgi:hypothetical protein